MAFSENGRSFGGQLDEFIGVLFCGYVSPHCDRLSSVVSYHWIRFCLIHLSSFSELP